MPQACIPRSVEGSEQVDLSSTCATCRFPNFTLKNLSRGFPGGAVVENLPANAGDTGSRPGLGGSHMPRSN